MMGVTNTYVCTQHAKTLKYATLCVCVCETGVNNCMCEFLSWREHVSSLAPFSHTDRVTVEG